MKKLAGACIIVFLMTISVGEALADCAWVAWTKNRLKSTSEGRINDEVTWEVHSAFEKRAQCVDMRERVSQRPNGPPTLLRHGSCPHAY